MPTIASVQASLTRLIASGAYAGDRLPAERELCQVLGASRTTVRRVIDRLAEAGVVSRGETGRVLILRGPQGGSLRRIAFLAPAFESAGTVRWEGALRRVAARRHPGLHIASLRFTGWEDPVLAEVKRGCDGVFLLPGAQPPPARLLELLAGPGAAVASLEGDLSAAGLPSLRLYPASSVETVLDGVYAHGHRRIGWLNTQPECPVTAANQETCRRWMRERGVDGPIVSDPVIPFEDPTPRAREAMRRCLRAHPDVTAWVCSVMQTARGAIRAIHDQGLVAGRDVSVATIDGEFQEDLNVPSLACAANVDPEPHLALCLAWMLDGATRAWSGPLLVQPASCAFHAGESLARRGPG
ncbi:MAG: GntR family transcriptional regulator [Planctomycetes bacterium]|nr:GntR family transcriptional regulator [Planctomycetota bacterium]